MSVYLCYWWPYVRLAFVPNMISSWNKVLFLFYYLFIIFFFLLLSDRQGTREKWAAKPTKWPVRPAKTHFSLGIRPDWTESSLCTQWVVRIQAFFMRTAKTWSNWADAQADLSLRWSHAPLCWFCHEAAQVSLDKRLVAPPSTKQCISCYLTTRFFSFYCCFCQMSICSCLRLPVLILSVDSDWLISIKVLQTLTMTGISNQSKFHQTLTKSKSSQTCISLSPSLQWQCEEKHANPKTINE